MTTHSRTGTIVRIIGIAGAAALALTACASPAPVPDPAPPMTVAEAAIERLAAGSCDSPEYAELGLMTTDGLRCGTLTVPIDRSAADSPTTGLTVVLTDQDAPRGVLLLIGGGPGGSSTWAVPTIRALMPDVAAQYQLVAMDLRGTGAGALDCPDVQQQVGSSDILAASADAIAACASSIGTWRDALSTEATVQDLDELRLALGVSEWALDGTSYGTFVAARYASSHPEAVGALVLDSVVPVEGVDPFLLSSFAALPDVLAEVCASEACETDPMEDLAAVLEAGYEPLPLFNMLVAYSVAAPSFTGVIDALASARAGDLGALDGLVAGMESAAASPLASFSAATHIATLCADAPMPWGASATPAERGAGLDAAIAQVPTEQTWPFPASVLGQMGTTFSCVHWSAASAAPAEIGDLTEIPALLLTGELDLSTPLANAMAMADRFGDPEIVSIPGAGHAAQMTPGGVGVVTDFLLAAR